MSNPISDTAVSLPAPALRPFITQYAGFRVSGLPPGVHFGLPKSDVDLIISLGRTIDVVQMPNSTQRQATFTALVSGLHEVPAIVRQGGDAFGLHVFIKPLGVRAILGPASAEISSLVLSLYDIWGNRAADLIEMLLGADTWQQRFAILDRAFVSKLNPTSPQLEISWAWGRLAKTPKLAARVFRFEHACRLIADKRPSLAQVAVACSYYDQAHLTREWHALAGCSPKTWIARELPFLQDYELGGRDNECHDLESVHQSFV